MYVCVCVLGCPKTNNTALGLPFISRWISICCYLLYSFLTFAHYFSSYYPPLPNNPSLHFFSCLSVQKLNCTFFHLEISRVYLYMNNFTYSVWCVIQNRIVHYSLFIHLCMKKIEENPKGNPKTSKSRLAN